MTFDIGNEHQDVYANPYKLKSNFDEWLCEKIANMRLLSYQQTQNKGYFGGELVSIGASKIHDWFSDSLRSMLSIGSRITQF